MRVTLNGESTPKVWDSLEEAEWPEGAHALAESFIQELRDQGYDGEVVAVNYFEPRPYRDEYDRGSVYRGVCVTIGRSVFLLQRLPEER